MVYTFHTMGDKEFGDYMRIWVSIAAPFVWAGGLFLHALLSGMTEREWELVNGEMIAFSFLALILLEALIFFPYLLVHLSGYDHYA